MRLYCIESGRAKVSRILGVYSRMLSLMALMLSLIASTLSAMCFLKFSLTWMSYFFLSVLERLAYHLSKASLARIVESMA